MTRNDVLKLFPDATEEQITNILNQNNSEVAREKAKLNPYKEKAEKTDELQKQFDELEASKLSENEKTKKALEVANQHIAELEKNNAIRDLREKAMTDFKITAEQAKTVVKDDGSFDTAELGKIITDKETASAQAKEQEIANNTTNPGGSSASGNEENKKPADVENAEKITFGEASASNEAKNKYVL